MKIIFFGTPEYVIPVLEALKKANYEIAAVVTQPPKPVGRKKILTPSPVAKWAEKEKIQIIHDRKEIVFEKLKKLDVPIAILAAYGRIIPQNVIDIFPMGILNIHPSLLPKYRGAIPVEAALVAGETETGVTIIKLDREMDHGPILVQKTESINKFVPDGIKHNDTRVTLRERLFKLGAELITQVLPDYMEGKVEPKEQDHNKATYVTLFKKDHGFIPPEYITAALQGASAPLQAQWEIPFIQNFTIDPSPQAIDRFIRAVNPWPGAFTIVKFEIRNSKFEKRLKILKAHIEPRLKNTSGVSPGSPRDIAVGRNSTNYLVLDEVQLESKNPVSWEQFKSGYPNFEFSE